MAGPLSRIVSFTCLSLMTFGVWFPNATPIFICPASAGQSGSSLLLKDDPLLKQRITVEATNLPLSDLLSHLSQNSKVDLVATPPIGNQRVTLRLDNQPLHRIMGRVASLLGHSPLSPRGYFWERSKRKDGARPGFRLWRDSRSLREEQDELAFPRKKAVQLLRDFRNLARMSPEQRKAYKGDLPEEDLTDDDLQPFRDALSGLSDTDIDTLANEGSVPLDTNQFANQISAYNRTWHDSESMRRDRAISSGAQDPYPNGVPMQPPTPPAIRFHVDDYGEDHPERSSLYGLYLEGANTLDLPPGSTGSVHVVLDPYRTADTQLPESQDQTGSMLDLTPFLTGKDVTPEQRGDMGFTLQALAKAAKINIYEEAFYKTVYWGARSGGLHTLKGTLPQILNAICKEWGYQVTKTGDDYVLWSKTWAQDRARDIPEPILAGWRARGEKQAGFTLEDRMEMASALTWPQARLTLTLALENSGPWERREFNILRFLGGFSPAERTRLEQDGVPFGAMDALHQHNLAAELLSKSNLSARQIEQSHLVLTYDKDPIQIAENKRARRAFLEVKAENGASLWQHALFSTALKSEDHKTR